MELSFKHNKLFTIFITLFYILGILGVFYNHQILFCAITSIITIFLILKSDLGFKKSLILYLIFFLGIIRAQNSYDIKPFINEIYTNDASIIGTVITTPTTQKENSRLRFYVKTNKINVYNKEFDEKTKIFVNIDYKTQPKIKIGDIVEIKGKMRTPKNSTNPYQFDYKNYLLNNDCSFILYAPDTSYFKIGTLKFSNNFENNWYLTLRYFETIREKILEKHSKNIKSPRLEILGGIVFGNETINPDETIKEQFKNSGLLHLLAASGLNVALIYGIWQYIASMVKFPYVPSIWIGCGLIILYTFMTGFPPSILRASLMLLFVLFGKLIDREADSVALIFFVGFLILLFNPKMFFDIGFQLSFAVTFGLISCCEVIISKFKKKDDEFKEKYKNLSRIKKYILFLFSPISLVSIVIVPLVAQMWVIPLQMHYFNNLAPLSILANIAVVPFIGILSFIGFISSILALIPKLSNIIVFLFDFVANPLLALLIKISEFFSSFKFSLISTISLNTFQIFNFWILILLFIYNLKYDFKSKQKLLCLLICLIIFAFSFIKLDYFKENLEIMMFDVENADSFLIKTPKNKYIMIDTGKKNFKGISSGEIIINKFLKNERITKLDLMIITHFDSDHCGGAVDILKSNKVNKIIIQKDNPHSELAKGIINYLKDNKLNYKIAKNNFVEYSEPNLTLTTFMVDNKSDNEASIISLLTYKDKNFLFMADASKNVFRSIENFLPNKIQVLKVGHHGAKDTIDNYMLDKIKPETALISTGINKFNHPHPDTISLLQDYNIKIISTRNYGFSKVVVKEDFKFYHFDKIQKKLENILFDKIEQIPFHKTKWFEDFVKKNL